MQNEKRKQDLYCAICAERYSKSIHRKISKLSVLECCWYVVITFNHKRHKKAPFQLKRWFGITFFCLLLGIKYLTSKKSQNTCLPSTCDFQQTCGFQQFGCFRHSSGLPRYPPCSDIDLWPKCSKVNYDLKLGSIKCGYRLNQPTISTQINYRH